MSSKDPNGASVISQEDVLSLAKKLEMDFDQRPREAVIIF
jgi:hypothetical protein